MNRRERLEYYLAGAKTSLAKIYWMGRLDELMKKQDLEDVQAKVDWEGFDYCFMNWDFKDIKDKQFHQLRELYKKAHKDLAEYIGME